MATQNQVLEALISEEQVTSTDDLATKVGTTKDTMRALCSKLKNKGYVDGSTKDGWVITSDGRDALERHETIPTTPEDVGADTKSKLEYYGKLAGVTPDLILATCEIILTGDPEDLEQVWEAMTQMDVPIGNRRRWFNLYRNYLKQGIPPALREKVSGSLETTGEEGEEIPSSSAKDRARDYIIADDMPVFVGHGQGDFSLKDAKDIIGMRTLRHRFTGQSGATPQSFGAKDILDIIEKINEGRAGTTPAKSYVVTQGEEGAVVQEIEPGQPILLNPQGGTKPPATYFVDGDGQVRQAQPGEPIVIKQQSQSPASAKTLVLRQTPEGIVSEEFEAGKPIIINYPSPSSNGSPVLPFPVFGSDGKPVVDQDGKPVYANLEPTLKWLGFQNEQKRADERHGALMGLVKTVRENVGDGVAALKAAAAEVRESPKSKSSSPSRSQVYECGSCHTKFTIPREDFEKVACPSCQKEYTREDVLST